MEITNIFPFLSIFAQNLTISPQKNNLLGRIQLGIIAYIFSKVINYQWAKCDANTLRNMDITNIFPFLSIFA